MSVQAALKFIHRIRQDDALCERVRARGGKGDLDQVAAIGAEAGFEFSVDELRQAFKHDWTMRWIRYGQGVTPPPDSDSRYAAR